jgi:adenylate cyclase class 2
MGIKLMLEIEMKFPVADFEPIVEKLASWQARSEGTREEADHYFNAPDRDFALTDEAVRLRRVGGQNWATYKGPRQPGPAKTRTEIEVPLAKGDATAELFGRWLAGLRFRPVAVVRKWRRSYAFERGGFSLHICLDEVINVGSYVELEIVAPPEQKDRAERVLQELAAELMLGPSERRSYLQLMLNKKQ